MPDLKGILNRLVSNEFDFVVIGGFAAVAHGSPLMTMDVDVCCDMSWGNLRKLWDAISDLHPVHRMTPKRLPLEMTERMCRGLRNLYLDTDFGQLDCLGEVMGLGDFRAVLARSVEIKIEEGICRVLSLDALIEAKEAMGRPRDRQTIMFLQEIRRETR